MGKSYSAAPACAPGPAPFCILGGRFKVEEPWSDAAGAVGPGMVAGFPVAGSGLLWFFAADKWELMAKAIDGCAVNGRYRCSSRRPPTSAMSSRWTDARTGAVRHYGSPYGHNAPAVTDSEVFTSRPKTII